MFSRDRGTIIIVSRIHRLNRCIWLTGKRTDYIAKGHVRKPGNAVVRGLARKHLVAWNGRVAFGAAGTPAPVIPHREEGATRAHRDVRLPLRTCRGITVQLERRTKRRSA